MPLWGGSNKASRHCRGLFVIESTFELCSEAADFVIGKEDVERKAERNAVSLVNDQKVSSSAFLGFNKCQI